MLTLENFRRINFYIREVNFLAINCIIYRFYSVIEHFYAIIALLLCQLKYNTYEVTYDNSIIT